MDQQQNGQRKKGPQPNGSRQKDVLSTRRDIDLLKYHIYLKL